VAPARATARLESSPTEALDDRDDVPELPLPEAFVAIDQLPTEAMSAMSADSQLSTEAVSMPAEADLPPTLAVPAPGEDLPPTEAVPIASRSPGEDEDKAQSSSLQDV
jgi:hypothetical protein